MRIKFWGVRGSLPSPLRAEQVQAKIAAVVSRITPSDLESEETKMLFLSKLPSWIYGTVGGNTPCVELRNKKDDLFLLDCGSGLRSFSVHGKKPSNGHYTVFLSHLHWDHIQGFPFFGDSFNPKARIDIYSGFENLAEYFEKQSSVPFFPPNGCWNSIKNQITFHKITEGEELFVNGVTVKCHKMNHPGDSYSYSFEEDGKKIIYATDAELEPSDFDTEIDRNNFFKNADVLILDTQYTNSEAIQKGGWGHNSCSNAVDFACTWEIKNLFFFHHEPNYDDKKLDFILQAGINYKKYKKADQLVINLAIEGQEVEL